LRYRLDPARPAMIGRAVEAEIRVDEDPHISRQHAEVRLHNGQLNVTTLPGSASPVFHQGERAPAFALGPGDHFVIGRTRFLLLDEPGPGSLELDDAPLTRLTLDAEEVQQGDG